YLKLCLTGSASDLIKDVSTTSANYESTWKALKSRYHNPRLIINKHLSAFKALPYLKRESADELRSFTDEAQRIVRALRNLKVPVDHWDTWLTFELSERLDPESRKLWESELSEKDRKLEETGSPTSLASFSNFVEFLEKRARILDMLAFERRAEKRTAPPPTSGPPPRKIHHVTPVISRSPKCPLCEGPHALMRCSQFKEKSVQDRKEEVKRLRLCFNCLGPHRANVCPSSGRCSTCQGKHHSSIHQQNLGRVAASAIPDNPENDGAQKPNTSVVSLHSAKSPTLLRKILLATARVIVVGPKGKVTYARALLDQGSESSFISEALVQLLELPKLHTHTPLSGIGDSAAGTARSMTQVTVRSVIESDFQVEAEMLVLPRVTSSLPSHEANVDLGRELFPGVTWADPEFHVRQKVDIVLGGDLYGQLLRPGLKKSATSKLVAQNTVLGWIVSGPMEEVASRRAEVVRACIPVRVLHCTAGEKLDLALQSFWALEEVPVPIKRLKPEDENCERQYQDTHFRDSQGRYVVKLPLKPDLPLVGAESRSLALGSLSNIQRRFIRDSKLCQSYNAFMEEYERLGHMSRVPPSEIHRPDAWYLPHHAVVQETSLNWKLRVVFDASRSTREGHSLNSYLFTGPPLQTDLSLVLLNWRRYRFVFTADIVKMFRQILVRPDDQDFQRIVWTPKDAVEPVDYRLNTVTYGTACAPYLAIRTLAQVAHDEGQRFPLGARCLLSETYVDDTFAGADDLDSAVRKRIELIELLGSAKIELNKWAANHPQLLPESARPIAEKQIDEDKAVKTLGVQWVPSQDEFRFTAAGLEGLASAHTKRSILSNISRLFDPLGWLAPVTVTAKILMQDMWILKCEWDSPLPAEIRERWYEYCKSLSALPLLSVTRWLGGTAASSYQVHGFSDASSRAYAAVVYLRLDQGNGNFRVSLLAAKSKVAPVKTVSIPNLELCGAALLVRLIRHLIGLDFLQGLPIFAWSDSQVVLTWLRKHPCHWKTFVANRVSFIQTELPSATWAHVQTKENPADLATRGVKPEGLADSALWWQGPVWLSKASTEWPRPAESVRINHVRPRSKESEILTRFSSLTKLLRVVARCRRPLVRLRKKKESAESSLFSFLTTSELSAARTVVIRMAQASAFEVEIGLLSAGKRLPKGNRLSSLNPFLCKEDGLLRVGGRLAHSALSFDQKHPPILPQDSALSLLFVRHAHLQCLHGGPTLTSSILMSQMWILGRNRLVKSTIRACVTCQRVKPHSVQQLMGELPAARVTRNRAFSNSGLDYAGPFQVRMSKGRGNRAYKGYIVLFVCFATRAIHLELVSDLSSAAFICAYRRFVGRRGICQNLYSDNATNFKGADKELQGMFRRASEFHQEVASLLANDGTNWTFIPPSTPHYGGLWEAGVRSVKHHLRRVVGEHTLTFEEFSTVLVEIEACLNSRPLGALNSDLSDLRALTPSHFLNEGAAVLLPDADVPDLPENRLNRFQLLQRIRDTFWKRWSTEYLLHLQEREKWRDPSENFAVGQLVLVKDDRYPPSKWPLGRVSEVHPGPDGLVRVVTVRMATSSLRRHIVRLCPLVLKDNDK
ncbi:uncharacterized protein LOC122499504, partial [Leptopilina heterotoma]|uniref:uncharacterized protein LOC122499504 n=1 Tax=Leptopilina heterotoma TaxID=63436 RepID=UPI001CA8331D